MRRPYSHDQAIRTRFGTYPKRRLSWPIRKCSFAYTLPLLNTY